MLLDSCKMGQRLNCWTKIEFVWDNECTSDGIQSKQRASQFTHFATIYFGIGIRQWYDACGLVCYIPYCLVVRISGFHPEGPGSIPGMGIFFSMKFLSFWRRNECCYFHGVHRERISPRHRSNSMQGDDKNKLRSILLRTNEFRVSQSMMQSLFASHKRNHMTDTARLLVFEPLLAV